MISMRGYLLGPAALGALTAGIMATGATSAMAGGFALREQSTTHQGA